MRSLRMLMVAGLVSAMMTGLGSQEKPRTAAAARKLPSRMLADEHAMFTMERLAGSAELKPVQLPEEPRPLVAMEEVRRAAMLQDEQVPKAGIVPRRKKAEIRPVPMPQEPKPADSNQ